MKTFDSGYDLELADNGFFTVAVIPVLFGIRESYIKIISLKEEVQY